MEVHDIAVIVNPDGSRYTTGLLGMAISRPVAEAIELLDAVGDDLEFARSIVRRRIERQA